LKPCKYLPLEEQDAIELITNWNA